MCFRLFCLGNASTVSDARKAKKAFDKKYQKTKGIQGCAYSFREGFLVKSGFRRLENPEGIFRNSTWVQKPFRKRLWVTHSVSKGVSVSEKTLIFRMYWHHLKTDSAKEKISDRL